ncbi:hypothetical protein GCM10029978_005090 [Actinoallomurus acanthiterrae]
MAAGGNVGQAVTGDGAVGVGSINVDATVVIGTLPGPGDPTNDPPRVRLNPDGTVPRVREVGLEELRIHPAARADGWRQDRQPSYVPRDCDEELERALAGGGLVIVEGRSAAGKSRAAAEAVNRVASDRLLYVPEDPAALSALAGLRGGIRDAVIWLDDLERFCGAPGLNLHLIHRLCPPGRNDVVVLATLRSEARGLVERQAGAHLLETAILVRPPFQFSPAERERAEQKRADPRIARWLDRGGDTGLPEYLAAGPAAVHRWQSGRNGAQLVGAALVSAAIDCRRAHYLKPLPRALLVSLYPHYLDRRDKHRTDLPELEESLEWAVAPVNGASSCLMPVGDERYDTFDYLVDHVQRDSASPPVPTVVWEALLDHAEGAVLTPVIVAAMHDAMRTGRLALMDRALVRYAQDAGFGSVARQVTMMILGSSSTQEGYDYSSRLKRWLRPFVEAGDSLAMAELGAHLLANGEPEEGEAWMRRSAAAGNDPAAVDVAMMLHENGRSAELDAWLDDAVTGGRGGVVTGFASWLSSEGNAAEAERLLRRAADANCTPAIRRLAQRAWERGALDEAKERYWQAVRLGDPDAMVELGVLYATSEEPEQAERLLRSAAAAGHVIGMHYLGVLLSEVPEKRREAEDWFRRAADAGHRPAAVGLAHLLYERQDAVGLTEWLERARQDADGGEAVEEFAAVLARSGDGQAAERWFRHAVDLGRTPSMNALGGLLHQRGATEEAMSWFRDAADRGHLPARLNLGLILRDTGALEEAEDWLREAADTLVTPKLEEQHTARVMAMFHLGDLLERQGSAAEAEQRYEFAAEWGHVDAMRALARLLSRSGREEQAADWLRRASSART